MRTVTANAFEDDAHPEGGHIVVLLHDVNSAPTMCEFRIKPSDGELPLDGWPRGVMKPITAKATSAGLELLLGPEVTSSTVLVPGTGVEIELPSASLRAEFVWPSVTATRRQKRRNLVAHPRTGKNGRGAGAEHLSLVVPPPEESATGIHRLPSAATMIASPGVPEAPGVETSTIESSHSGNSAMSSSILSKLDALDAIAGLGELTTSVEAPKKVPEALPAAKTQPEASKASAASAAAADGVLAMLADLKKDIDVLKREQASQPLPPGEQQLKDVLAELKRDIASLQREQHVQVLPGGEQQLRDVLSELKRDIVSLKHETSAAPLPPGEQQLRDVLNDLKRDIVSLKHETSAAPLPPGEQQLRDVLAELKRDIVSLKHEQTAHPGPAGETDLYAMLRDLKRDISTLQSTEGHGHTASMAAAAMAPAGQGSILGLAPFKALAAGVPLIALALFGIYSLVKPQAPASLPSFAPVAAVAPASNPATPVYDALAAGTVSPRGVSVAGVDAAQALSRATSILAASGAARDTEEARFWLKRYLAIAHADKPVIRAITQLGTVYAQPVGGGAPDYGKARDVWEISSALGDPVAMCFLGSLFEYGLGVGLNKQTAFQWYERAKTAGGCTGVDEAMARVRL